MCQIDEINLTKAELSKECATMYQSMWSIL